MLDAYVSLSDLAEELHNTNVLLLRLVQAVERVSPVLPSSDDTASSSRPADLTDITQIDDAAQEQAHAGRAAIAARFGVVLDSTAFQEKLLEYELEMKKVHGANSTVDWEEVFKEAGEQARSRD